jgi:hypothetical protein
MKFDVELNNKSYNYWKVPKNILQPLDDTVFPFDPTWKKIAVNVSGGADSACGTATLCTFIEKTKSNAELIVISNVRVWNNRPWAAPISLEVFEKLQSMFPNIKMTRLENFIPPELEDGAIGKIAQLDKSGDRICTNSFNSYVQHRYDIDAVYGFITNNPMVKKFKHRGEPWDRKWNWEKVVAALDCPQWHFNNERRTVLPWRLLSKDFVIGQYYKNGWEDLLNITRSCEGDKLLLPQFEDYTTYKHGKSPLPECLDLTDDLEKGCCYWCAERKWAIDSAKKKLKIK